MCVHCGSNNVNVTTQVIDRKRGLLASLAWIFSGLWLIALLKGRKHETRVLLTCNDCLRTSLVDTEPKFTMADSVKMCVGFICVIFFLAVIGNGGL